MRLALLLTRVLFVLWPSLPVASAPVRWFGSLMDWWASD